MATLFSSRYCLCVVVFLALLKEGYGQSRTATTRTVGTTGAANSECVILAEDAEGLLERIDPKKFLFVDNEQRSYLQRACDNYKKMHSLSGCVPQQQNSIFDFACDTVLEMAQASNSACWNRTTSCALVKLVPSTDAFTAAYCKFLTATGVQLGCALELAPACESPSNSAISQAATKGRSFLDTFQCAVLSSDGGSIPINVTGVPSVEVIGQGAGTTGVPVLGTTAGGLFGRRNRVTEPPLVMKGKLSSCDFGQNARGLMCAASLLGVQDKFSDASQSLIFNELAKDNSTDLVEVCQKFDAYYDCMTKQVFQPEGHRCQTKSHVHDFSLLFYAFCDPANQPRIQKIRPCVQKLLNNKDRVQSATFQRCRENLTTMRTQVRVVIKESQNSVALCRGMLAAEAFFDCIPPVVSAVCDNQALSELAFFRQWIADNINTVGCPLDDPRISNYTHSKQTVTQAVTAATTTPVDVLVKSATIGIIESEDRASTVKVDETVPVPVLHENSVGDKCSEEDVRRFTVCYANISNIDFNPFTIIKKPEQMEAVCEAFDRYQSCRDTLECMPPAGDGLNNMLGFFCTDDNNPYMNYTTCMKQTAQTSAGQTCANHVLPMNFMAMTVDQSCAWANEVINCSYNELLNRCGIDAADFTFKMWQGYAKGINISCLVEAPVSSNATILGTPIECSAAEGDIVEKCMEPFSVITDRLAALIEGGLQAFMKAMRKITEIFKAGCDSRVGFDDCMRKGISKGSKCHVSSCLIKVTEYACNFSGDSDMSLEDRLKCMWSMIGEPEFGRCLKLFPKNAFANINRLRLYLPRFVNCLESPLLRKCGQTTLNLVKALSSQATSNPNDQTCAVIVTGMNDNGTIGQGVARSGTARPALESGATTVKTIGAGAAGPVGTVKPAPSTSAPVVDTRPLCRSPQEASRLEKCHMLLNNRSLEPQPLKIFSSPAELDAACNVYKDFANCTRALPCRFEFTAAEQEVMLRVCTVRYEDYKAVANCLIPFANGPRGQECSAPLYRLNLTQPQTDGGQAACQAVNAMMGCINPDLYNQCQDRAVDVVFDLHTAFAKQFKPDCAIKPPVLLTPGTDCTNVEIAAFESCLKKASNYSINPVSIIGDPDQWGAFCKVIQTDMQTCLTGLTCSPKPFVTAYNDTFVYACTSDDIRVRYDKYKACLATVLNTEAGQQCVETYKGIQWYGGDDPKGNAGRACKAVSSTLSCAAPEVSQRCEQDALKLVYELNQRMMTKIQPDCQLVIPSNLPGKINLTTTPEPPALNKTTPPKAKEATTTPPNGATDMRHGQSVFGMTLVSWIVFRMIH